MSDIHPPARHASLLSLLEQISAYGATPDGGVHRPEGSQANGELRRYIVQWLQSNGFSVRVDRIGNLFGIMDLCGAEAPVVLTGSHIDSQPYGGRLDGAYGVAASCIAAVNVVREIRETTLRPKCNLGVVAWTNEEGARFQPSTLGSSAYTGLVDLDWALDRRDLDGISLRSALGEIGFLGTDEPPPTPCAYVELHVECGSKLEATGRRLGVFDRWWGVRKIDLRVIGAPSHTGPTPMRDRRDALYGASLIIAAVRELVDEHDDGAVHTSVGQIDVLPNSPNVVPSDVKLCIEIRSGHSDLINSASAKLMRTIEQICQRNDLQSVVERDELRSPGRFSPALVNLARRVSNQLGEEMSLLETIAGHDAIRLAPHCPAIVAVVPSICGICHSPRENTTAEDLSLGLDMLIEMLRTLVVDGFREEFGPLE